VIRILALASLSAWMGLGERSAAQGALNPARPAEAGVRSNPASRRQPKVLHPSSARTTIVPEFSFVGLPQTDEAGNLYFQLGPLHDAPKIFRLVRSDEGSSEIFRLPAEFSQNDPIDFTVTASGHVYLLTLDRKNLYHAIRLEADGNAKETKLDAPEGLWLSAVGVFDNDTILVVGHYGPDAPENLRGTQYAALFDSSGKRLSDLRKRLSARKPISDTTLKYNGYTIRPGMDGNLYLLEPNSVLAISASGAMVRRLKFVKPDPEDDAIGLSVSGGLLCIELNKVEPDKLVKPKFLVLDAATGRDLGYFAPPDEKSEWIGFTRDEGFIFREEQVDKVKFFTAAMN
jgi:hypothetical protein